MHAPETSPQELSLRASARPQFASRSRPRAGRERVCVGQLISPLTRTDKRLPEKVRARLSKTSSSRVSLGEGVDERIGHLVEKRPCLGLELSQKASPAFGARFSTLGHL